MDSTHRITLVAPPDDVNAVHSLLSGVWSDFPWVTDTDRLSFETALIELASNVIRHSTENSEVSCELSVEIVDGALEARLRDTGEARTIDLNPRGMPDSLAEQGRGIPLIQALVDEVEYEREGSLNHWRIRRTLAP